MTGVEVIPNSGHLVSCSLDGSMLFWDYVMGTVLHRWERVVRDVGGGAEGYLRMLLQAFL